MSAYSGENVLGYAFRPGAALARSVDPLGLERAVRERLVGRMHPHRAAALGHDPGREAEVIRVRVCDDEIGDVLDPVARQSEAADEGIPAGGVAGGAAVDERDAVLCAGEDDGVDVRDPGPDEGQPHVPQTRSHLEHGDGGGVERADVGSRADHGSMLLLGGGQKSNNHLIGS